MEIIADMWSNPWLECPHSEQGACRLIIKSIHCSLLYIHKSTCKTYVYMYPVLSHGRHYIVNKCIHDLSHQLLSRLHVQSVYCQSLNVP